MHSHVLRFSLSDNRDVSSRKPLGSRKMVRVLVLLTFEGLTVTTVYMK